MARSYQGVCGAIVVSVEPLSTETGLWCNTCMLGSGILHTAAVTIGATTTLRSVKVCHDCGGTNVSD